MDCEDKIQEVQDTCCELLGLLKALILSVPEDEEAIIDIIIEATDRVIRIQQKLKNL